jgi:hypothetical protein
MVAAALALLPSLCVYVTVCDWWPFSILADALPKRHTNSNLRFPGAGSWSGNRTVLPAATSDLLAEHSLCMRTKSCQVWRD